MVEGVISRVNANPWKDKIFYSFALSGQEGWYNLGMKRPPKEGTSVRFNFITNTKGFKDVEGPIEIRTDGSVGETPSVNQVVSTSSSKSKSPEEQGFWQRKEGREVRNDELREIGATRNTAIAIIDLMIKHEAVKLPAGTAKREGFLWDLLNRYVDKLRGKESIEKDASKENEKSPEPTSNDPEADGWN